MGRELWGQVWDQIFILDIVRGVMMWAQVKVKDLAPPHGFSNDISWELSFQVISSLSAQGR